MGHEIQTTMGISFPPSMVEFDSHWVGYPKKGKEYNIQYDNITMIINICYIFALDSLDLNIEIKIESC